jgi:hypothetical protein
MILPVISGNALVQILEGDFIVFSIREGGPGPRSCHKICLDEKNRLIYVLGRYIEPDGSASNPIENDFWKYDTVKKSWTLISANTHVMPFKLM